jgi:hypothetical protein
MPLAARLRLLLLSLALLGAACDETEFLARVSAVANTQLPAGCTDVPSDFVVATITNDYMFKLALLQRRSLTAVAGSSAACLLPRSLFVCMHALCTVECGRHGVPCARYPTADLGASHFRENAYAEFTALKWSVARSLLSVLSYVLVLDSDVLVFSNPLAGLDLGAFDFRFQLEGAPPGREREACSGDSNGGVLFFRASLGATRMLDEMVALHDAIVAPGAPLDQTFALPAARRANASFCNFPQPCVLGKCTVGWWQFPFILDELLGDVCVYHATCMTSLAVKSEYLNRVLEARVAPGGERRTVRDVLMA